MKILTKFTWSGPHKEVGSGEVRVEPNQSLSIAEIFSRFAQGILTPDDLRSSNDYGEEIDDKDVDSISAPDYAVDEMDLLNEASRLSSRMSRKAKVQPKADLEPSVEEVIETDEPNESEEI